MRLASVLCLAPLLACGPGPRSAAPEQAVLPAPSASAAPGPITSAFAAPADAGAPAGHLAIVHETMHENGKATFPVARLGDMEPQSLKLSPIDPKPGALAGGAAETACYVATRLTADVGASCSARIESVTASGDGVTLGVVVDADFEQDTMQSRSRTHVALRGSIVLDRAHTVTRASFRGEERFSERMPCEKLADCDSCDPLVRSKACKAECYCPFQPAGTADLETNYAR